MGQVIPFPCVRAGGVPTDAPAVGRIVRLSGYKARRTRAALAAEKRKVKAKAEMLKALDALRRVVESGAAQDVVYIVRFASDDVRCGAQGQSYLRRTRDTQCREMLKSVRIVDTLLADTRD